MPSGKRVLRPGRAGNVPAKKSIMVCPLLIPADLIVDPGRGFPIVGAETDPECITCIQRGSRKAHLEEAG
jgi:hypothetical protein